MQTSPSIKRHWRCPTRSSRRRCPAGFWPFSFRWCHWWLWQAIRWWSSPSYVNQPFAPIRTISSWISRSQICSSAWSGKETTDRQTSREHQTPASSRPFDSNIGIRLNAVWRCWLTTGMSIYLVLFRSFHPTNSLSGLVDYRAGRTSGWLAAKLKSLDSSPLVHLSWIRSLITICLPILVFPCTPTNWSWVNGISATIYVKYGSSLTMWLAQRRRCAS